MGDEQILRKVRNNYRSRNLIGHYPFWVISPRNSTSFTRPFLVGRCAWEGHETIVGLVWVWDQDYKNISGVGLGLGLRLQERVTDVHSELYKTVDIETETDHKWTNRFSVVFLIPFPHRVYHNIHSPESSPDTTFDSAGRGEGDEATNLHTKWGSLVIGAHTMHKQFWALISSCGHRKTKWQYMRKIRFRVDNV